MDQQLQDLQAHPKNKIHHQNELIIHNFIVMEIRDKHFYFQSTVNVDGQL